VLSRFAAKEAVDLLNHLFEIAIEIPERLMRDENGVDRRKSALDYAVRPSDPIMICECVCTLGGVRLGLAEQVS
jgi:hypothetical protein